MFKTKKDVDLHVRTQLSKFRTDAERNLRSFTIAKLYYKINEFPTAEQYLRSYMSVKQDNDQAHKLLAQSYLRQNKVDKALQSFQQSLQLNQKQSDVLGEVCQLLLDDKNFNINKANYWCEMAEREKVQHEAVLSLRLKIINTENAGGTHVEDLLQKEICSNPNDVQLRVRLVRCYIDQERILEAFKYVYNLEMTMNDNFAYSADWYSIVWLVLSKYEQIPTTKKDWEFWLLLVMCLERQVYISFSISLEPGTGGLNETANLLFKLDQYLFQITQLSEKLSAQKELVKLFLEHYRGQILLHAASLLFKRELLQNKNKWKETVTAALPLLLLAFQVEVPASKEPWMKHSNEEGVKLIQLWSREGSFRCAQAGRTLLSCITDENLMKDNPTLEINKMVGNDLQLWGNEDELLAEIRQTCSDKHWRRNIFSQLFCNTEQKLKEQSSLLTRSPKMAEPIFEMPALSQVEIFEEEAQYLKPQSLQHIVYLYLGTNNLACVRGKFFKGLKFSTQNLAFCGAESLNQLDVDTFLCAATIQAKRSLDIEREAFVSAYSGIHSAAGRPRILPFVNLQGQLCAEDHTNWWQAAYQVYKNINANFSEIRANLQNGIEVVRCIDSPNMDMIIIFQLGQIMAHRAEDFVKPEKKAFLEARAELLYKYGLYMLRLSNKGCLEPFPRYFKYAKANTTAVDRQVAKAAENAVSFLATRYFKKSEYEELIGELSGIQLPLATYLQAEAYRKMDECNKTPKTAKRKYLDLAVNCLNQTQQLLQKGETDPDHPLHSLVQTEMKNLQLATLKYFREGSPLSGHNNSSTYEDAEAEFQSDVSLSAMNRSKREAIAAALLTSPRFTELENTVKQMASTLSFVKDMLVESIKPEVLSMRKDVNSLKEKVASLEEAMKRTRISSNPPSRDDASNVLEDLYMIDDAFQNHIYQPSSQPHMPLPGAMFSNGPNAPGGVHTPFVSSQQQQTQSRNTMQLQQNAIAAAAAYNSPIFNPNYPMNYYTQQYMMSQSSAAGGPAAGLLGQRALPYIDNALNFNIAPTTPLMQPPTQDARAGNLYGLLAQQPQPGVAPQLPQLSVPMSLSQLVAPSATIANVPMPVAGATPSSIASQPVLPVAQFNKALNNQPVEKVLPANVVITSSDPLPNPNSASLLTQQPMLSVTIPPQHIKPSLVSTTETTAQPLSAISQPPTTNVLSSNNTSGFVGFGLSGPTLTTAFTGFGSSLPASNSTANSIFSGTNINTISSSAVTTSVSSTTLTTFSFKPQIEKAQALAAASTPADDQNDSTLNKTSDSNSSETNKSGNEAEVEYDPRPDFKPIIPLPDEIEVKTGEEDEEVTFCCRAKLFRFVEKDWKERGIGDIKILKNKEGYSRILMRRDQTHKICANHKITKELQLTTPNAEKKGHIWVANDFADEELKVETFFVRFKLPESAQLFSDAFKKAQKEAEMLDAQKNTQKSVTVKSNSKSVEKSAEMPSVAPTFGLSKSGATNFATSTPAPKANKEGTTTSSVITSTANSHVSTAPNQTASKTLFSGFPPPTAVIASATTNTNKADPVKSVSSPFANLIFEKPSITSTTGSTVTSASPFANLFGSSSTPFSAANLATVQTSVLTTPTRVNQTTTLNKSNASDAEDDYTPTAEFTPVIPLPDLVELSTGEENEIVLFEHRAKLLRFDKDTTEWKERGIGNIKLLQEKDNVNKVRLIMRRDQVHKLCCNQRLYKDTVFKYSKNSQTALCWVGQDFSENELITETFTVRFKTAETCKEFYDAVKKAQDNMSVDEKPENVKTNNVAHKEEEKQKQVPKTEKDFGEAFKQKPGTWECKSCYVFNTSDKLYCSACDAPKDGTVPKKEATNLLNQTSTTKFSFGFASATVPSTAVTSFSFGTPSAVTSSTTNSVETTAATAIPAVVTKPTESGFGDKFKLKAGSWSCQSCYLNNDSEAIYCKACEAPKDDTVPTKESESNVLALSNPAQNFSFGFGSTNSNTEIPATTSGFIFGASKSAQEDSGKPLFASLTTTTDTGATKPFTFAPTTVVSSSSGITLPTFSFTMQSKPMRIPNISVGGGDGQTDLPFSLDKKDFNFTLKPKSPGKSGKSPVKFGCSTEGTEVAEDDADDGDYHEEEENNTYFAPVIPLPDKVDVKTGEEDEEILYVHRAKLYRFVDGEWKERGVGDVKILRHKETKKLRVVMRRDQVLKICLNHVLNEDVEYKVKDDKSWLFVVNDYTEGTVELQKFSLRFKSKEIAQEFMQAVKDALSSVAFPDNSIATLSNEEKDTADKLLLPYEFFNAQPPCPGCRGCNPEVFNFGTTLNFGKPEDDNPLGPLEMPKLTVCKTPPSTEGSANRSFLKQSVFTAGTSTTNNSTPNSGNIFSGFGVKPVEFGSLGASEKNASAFSFTAALNSSEKKDENKSGTGGFVFGGNTTTTNVSGGSLFGGTGDRKPVSGERSIFGNVSAKSNETTTGTGTPSAFSGGSLFGGKPMFGGVGRGATIFNNKSFGSSETTQPTFGSLANTQTAASGNSKFESTFSNVANVSTTQPSLFGGANTNTNTNGGSSMFSGLADKEGSSPMTFADLSSKAGVVDFASLAAKANSTPQSKSAEKPGMGGFIGLTGGDSFSSFSKSINKQDDSTQDAENDENYDPHYEPIIELPDEIVLSTGEEDETKLFGERAKLFRYDANTKEWKERGVGELKLLFHPVKQSYRLLMRREQIHKLVLNHVVGADFIYNMMKDSPKSYVWASMNYAESTEGELEKLAVRFKNEDIGAEFSKILKECIEKAKQRSQ